MSLFLKHMVSLMACLALCCSLVGCGGSGEPTSVTDGADAEAIADYERMMAESEEEANNDGADDE